MLLALLLALIGFLVGGPAGFLIGAALGLLVGSVARVMVGRGIGLVQSRFVDATFSVMGALCKADGVVSRDEIRVTQELMSRLHLTEEDKDAAKEAFRRGKAPDFDLDAAVDAFARTARGSAVLFSLFLQVQLSAVAADGEVHPAEREMLVRIARRLGLGDRDVAQLEAMLKAFARGEASPSGGPPREAQLRDAYAALGLTPEASESEIKSAYRKLIRDHHPDRLAAKGVPESMREVAEQRSRHLNAAYELLKRARQFT